MAGQPLPLAVWNATVDQDRFTVRVVRTSSHRGLLTVRLTGGNNIIKSQEVGLSYGAAFGPDVDDIATWKNIALQAIDDWIAENDPQPKGEEDGRADDDGPEGPAGR